MLYSISLATRRKSKQTPPSSFLEGRSTPPSVRSIRKAFKSVGSRPRTSCWSTRRNRRTPACARWRACSKKDACASSSLKKWTLPTPNAPFKKVRRAPSTAKSSSRCPNDTQGNHEPPKSSKNRSIGGVEVLGWKLLVYASFPWLRCDARFSQRADAEAAIRGIVLHV